MKKKKFWAAIVQMKSSINKQDNLLESLKYIKEAAYRRADYIFFPEFQMAFSSSTQTPDELYNSAEPLANSKFLKKICKYSEKYKIGIVGTFFEKNPYQTDKKVFDTAFCTNKNGKIVSVYRKLHLYDAFGFKESLKFNRGDEIPKLVPTAIGKMGLMICYDIRFPELSRILTVNGSDIIVIPSGWVHGIMKEEHWITMLKARAIENGVYVIAPNQVGNIFCGRSMIVDPLGSILTDLGDKRGIEYVEIQKERISEVRKTLPLLKNRRSDIYNIKILN
ncbi:MAG TPA: carbon-nitrogen hydrolase family protein [Nitrososphaeraceae archaeon]|nr:carbon-nitrogen hydrolase family protein [Nitrososphaeraceae archaeon]